MSDQFIAGNSGRGRGYPAADALNFADDIHKVIEHGGGSAVLRTDNANPLVSPGQLVENDHFIREALTAAEAAGFTVAIASDAKGHDVTVQLRLNVVEGKNVEEEIEKDELWGMDQTPESKMRIADLIRMARQEPEMIEPIGYELSEQQDDQQRLADS